MEYVPQKAERTKAQLGEAVISLLKELPSERITAEAIASRAGMGRATWFRHFSSKSEAVSCALYARWMRQATEVGYQEGAGMLPLLQLVYAQQATVSLLYQVGMGQAVHEAAGRFAEALNGRSREGLGYRSRFYLYGFVGVVDEWVRREFVDRPQDVAAALIGIPGID